MLEIEDWFWIVMEYEWTSERIKEGYYGEEVHKGWILRIYRENKTNELSR